MSDGIPDRSGDETSKIERDFIVSSATDVDAEVPLSADSPVAKDEILYRSIQQGIGHMVFREGKCRPSSQAFADRKRECSVDRAALLGNNATRAKFQASDHVSWLRAGEVRLERVTQHATLPDEPTRKVELIADVWPQPDESGQRPAHAVIRLTPDHGNSSNYKKLCEALALKAQWVEAEPNPCH